MNTGERKKNKGWIIIIIIGVFNPMLGIILAVIKVLVDNANKKEKDTSAPVDEVEIVDVDSSEVSDAKDIYKEAALHSTDPLERKAEEKTMEAKVEEEIIEEEKVEEEIIEEEIIEEEIIVEATESNSTYEVDHLEKDLNESMEDLHVEGDIPTTRTDVHASDEVEADGKVEGHNHEEATPIKVLTCRMCGMVNNIYHIDVFETPTCQKCGMLLFDRE